jgi:hypothetical protein
MIWAIPILRPGRPRSAHPRGRYGPAWLAHLAFLSLLLLLFFSFFFYDNFYDFILILKMFSFFNKLDFKFVQIWIFSRF